MKLWEKSVSLDASFPIVHRNIAVAYSHQKKGEALVKAIASLEKAVSLEPRYALHFFELDELYEAAGTAPERRLAMLEKNHDIVQQRDDALSREVGLKVIMGKYDEAIQLMTGRHFAVWEGGSLNIADFWTDAHLLRGREHFAAKRYKEALSDYQAAIKIPENLPSERRGGAGRNAEMTYWIGTAYEALGEQDKARQCWEESASTGLPRGRRWGGSGRSEGNAQMYYRALAIQKLGENEKAAAMFSELIKTGEKTLQEEKDIDFFTSFGESTEGGAQRDRLAHAHYIAGLGYLGLGEKEKAIQQLTQALEARPDHLGAKTVLAGLR
jgi:tetratricopeptide (TPR) repeat protein